MEARPLAAFPAADHADKTACFTKHRRFLLNPTILSASILADGELAEFVYPLS